jgi:hypothetical protein
MKSFPQLIQLFSNYYVVIFMIVLLVILISMPYSYLLIRKSFSIFIRKIPTRGDPKF